MQSRTCLRSRLGPTALLLAVLASTWSFQTASAQVLRQSVQALKIRSIEGKDTVWVGDVETYRVVVNDSRDVEYRWSTGDRSAFGNPVVHRFERPGTFKVIVTARNVVSTVRDSLTITVFGSEQPRDPIAAEVKDPVQPTVTGENSDSGPVAAPANAGNDAASKPAAVRNSDRGAGPAQASAHGVAQAPPSKTRAAFKGTDRVSENSGGFTWVVATYFQRPPAVALSNSYRASGYRSGVIADQKGLGSQVFRVILGEFDTEEEALRARRYLINAGHKNVLLQTL